jgi:hypothetical protein
MFPHSCPEAEFFLADRAVICHFTSVESAVFAQIRGRGKTFAALLTPNRRREYAFHVSCFGWRPPPLKQKYSLERLFTGVNSIVSGQILAQSERFFAAFCIAFEWFHVAVYF